MGLMMYLLVVQKDLQEIYVNKGNDSFAPIKQFDLDSDANYEDTAASFLMLIMVT
jgi:hypothetical protein